eukprot:CAMPEP_0182856038 /NCGR_PEP_ID=MMETSP0034_2-20130328/2202_1 /TAXON_ID=156128 /ORGANISM="Nephroselmis pyriformis, Strain CCMP717" /LENGTH=198 /DNA_ID=CAMNT_0024987075 /DNA_START=266 /DNA_END=861 /DNA_ORIENTATION=-
MSSNVVWAYVWDSSTMMPSGIWVPLMTSVVAELDEELGDVIAAHVDRRSLMLQGGVVGALEAVVLTTVGPTRLHESLERTESFPDATSDTQVVVTPAKCFPDMRPAIQQQVEHALREVAVGHEVTSVMALMKRFLSTCVAKYLGQEYLLTARSVCTDCGGACSRSERGARGGGASAGREVTCRRSERLPRVPRAPPSS